MTLEQQLKNVELIFVQRLRNPEKAKEIYSSLKERIDSPGLIKILEKRILELGK